MKRFNQARPFLILGIAFAAWLVLPLAVKRFARLTFFEFQAPVDVAASRVRDLQDYWALRTRSKNDLIEAGKELARLNSFYENTIRQAASLQQEVARMEELMRMPPHQEYRAEPARVVRRDFSAWWQRVIIRKGRDHGIEPGAPVIFTGGVVGRVSQVGLRTSVVDLITNPGVRLSAVVETDPSQRPVIFQGRSTGAFRDATATVSLVPLDVFASPGGTTRVVTSGLGGEFPPGLALGSITKIEGGSDGMFKSGVVQVDSRLSSLTEVTVLVPVTRNNNNAGNSGATNSAASININAAASASAP